MKKLLATGLIFAVTAISLLGVFSTQVNADFAYQSCKLLTGRTVNCVRTDWNDSTAFQEVKVRKGLVTRYGDTIKCVYPSYDLAQGCFYVR